MTDIQPSSRYALTLDVTLYEHFLEDSTLSDAQKQQFLETLWSLICEFVWLGFEITPTQQVIQSIPNADQQ